MTNIGGAMKDKAILIVPLFTYDFDEAELVVKAALKLIANGKVSSVVVSSHYGFWEKIKMVAKKTDKKIIVDIPYNPSNEELFFQDVAKRMINVKGNLKDVLILSLERRGLRHKDLIWEIYQANIVSFQCTFWIKLILVKPLSSYFRKALVMVRNWGCQRKWCRNEA